MDEFLEKLDLERLKQLILDSDCEDYEEPQCALGEQSADDALSQRSDGLERKKNKNGKKKSVMNLAIPEEEPRKAKDEESPDRKSAGKRKAECDLETALSLYAAGNREDKESALLLERLGQFPPLEKRPRLDSIPFLAIPSPFQGGASWAGGC